MKYIFYLVLAVSIIVFAFGVYGDIGSLNVKGANLTPVGSLLLPLEILGFLAMPIGAFGLFQKARWGYLLVVLGYILLLFASLVPLSQGSNTIGLAILISPIGLVVTLISRKSLQA